MRAAAAAVAVMLAVTVVTACSRAPSEGQTGRNSAQSVSAQGPRAPEAGQAGPVARTRDDLLDTVITITVYDGTDAGIIDDAFERIAAIEKAMSATLQGSEIRALSDCAGKSPATLSDETYRVVKEAYEMSIESGGAFNLAVGPLVRLWGVHTEAARVPGAAEIEAALNLTDYNDVVLSDGDKSVYLKREGMGVDLGAIAKGYAGDAAAQILKDGGSGHAILDLGGNIVAIGGNPNGDEWKIGVRDPIEGGCGYIAVVRVRDKAVVTSGAGERYFESGGRRYHHIFDSSTGYPAESGLLSVTIIADNSAEADKLSTAAFVLGLQGGLRLLENYKGAEAVFITDGFEVYVTPGLKSSFALADDRFSLANE